LNRSDIYLPDASEMAMTQRAATPTETTLCRLAVKAIG